MAMSMDNLVKCLPTDAKGCTAALAKDSDLQMLLFYAEQIEVKMYQEKIDDKLLAMSLLYQLLCYMILNQMGNAKYLWRRLPKELKADPTTIGIWAIGQSMWRSEYSSAFELMDNLLGSNDIAGQYKPFLNKLSIEYRRRCLDMVTLSYSSISVKELLGYICNIKNKEISNDKDSGIAYVNGIIKNYNLQDKWTLDEQKGIVEINNAKEEYELDANLMNDFTQYVCFMESIQNV